MIDLCVHKGLGERRDVFGKRLYEVLRLTTTSAYKYSVPAVNMAEDGLLRSKFLRMFLFCFFQVPHVGLECHICDPLGLIFHYSAKENLPSHAPSSTTMDCGVYAEN